MNPIQLWWTTTPRALRTLMAVVGGGWVVYLVATLVAGAAGALPFDLLALRPPSWTRHPWALLTHSFVLPARGIGPLLSVVFALMILNQIGRDAEQLLGPRWLVSAWLLATAGAGLAAVGTASFLGEPQFVAGPWTALLGLMMALGVRFPEKSIGLMFLGVVRLVYAAAGFVVVSMLLSGSVYTVIADLGALAAGGAFGAWSKRQVGRRPSRTAAPPGAGPRRDAPRAAAPRRSYSQTDLDKVLEKISAHGMDALTPEERRVLDEASRN